MNATSQITVGERTVCVTECRHPEGKPVGTPWHITECGKTIGESRTFADGTLLAILILCGRGRLWPEGIEQH